MKTVSFLPGPDSGARVVGYLHDVSDEILARKVRPCVVICPGGAYRYLSAREADPPAMAFFSKGYQVFLLYYSVQEKAKDLRPLTDASKTLLEIRRRSGEWQIDPKRIAVCGFSAGGHVAASLGTLWDSSALKDKMDTFGGRNRPDALILCYPVITVGEYTHEESALHVCGGTPTEEQVRFFSLEKQVSEKTPPAFLWHTCEDASVPVENTLLFAAALRRAGVPFECHIFPNGQHGLSLCNEEVGTPNARCADWFPLCSKWLSELFHFTY